MSISTNNCNDFDDFLERCVEAYEKKDYQDCLFTALNCFKLAVDSEEFQKKVAAIRIIKFSSEMLIKELKSQVVNCEINVNSEMCCLCDKSKKKLRFIKGIDINICHDCIEAMYDAIQEK